MREWNKLAAQYPDREFRSRFQQVFPLSRFVKSGIWTPSLTIEEEWEHAVALTPEGEAVLDSPQLASSPLSTREKKFLLFRKLFHEGLLVDLNATDIRGIEAILERKLASQEIVLPWMFDRVLYDRAFDLNVEARNQTLSPAQTTELLRDTPLGVFQIGFTVLGPFGFSYSAQGREFPILRNLVLGHCADANCSAIHVSQLMSTESPLLAGASLIARALKNSSAREGSWERLFLEHALPPGYYYDDYWPGDMVWFLGNAFSHHELQQLLCRLLTLNGRNLRSRFPRGEKWRELFAASAADLPLALSKPQVLHLILLALDEEIMAATDSVIEDGTIRIPGAEVRTVATAIRARNWLGATVQCSSLGVRVASRTEGSRLAPARLRKLLLDLYPADIDRKQLYWTLRNVHGSTIGEKIELYIGSETPEDALRKLAFTDEEKVRACLNQIRAPHLELPGDQRSENRLIFRMLWKIGFPATVFPSPLKTLLERLSNLRQAALRQGILSDEVWREQVRSVGANVFVSLEEVLDQSLPFLTWLLLSDHLEEKHEFNLDRARRFTQAQISGVLSTDRGPIEYLADSKNTLFPLISAYSALLAKIKQLFASGADSYLKPKILMGHYSHASDLQCFPYKHRHFILDMSTPDVEAAIGFLEASAEDLQRSGAMSVRNAIDHHSPNFPTAAEIQTCCDVLSAFVTRLDDYGFMPTLSAHVCTVTDIYGRTTVVSRNYAGKELQWRHSPALEALQTLPDIQAPQILVPSIRIAETAEIVRFKLDYSSDYDRLWSDYPRRRPPSNGELLAAEAVPNSAD